MLAVISSNTLLSTKMASSFSLLFLLLTSSAIIAAGDLPFTIPRCDNRDKKALLAIKRHFNDRFISWTSTSHCCEWIGVQCDPNSARVVGLRIITDDGLVGTIPPALEGLPELTSLFFHKLPNLTGTIPPEITKLSKLRFLTISWTSVYGPVPTFLSKLPALEALDLSFNKLSGTIPPSLGDVSSCYAIDISRNQLVGSIPSTLFRNISWDSKTSPYGPYLTLSHNNLTGEIPRDFAAVNFSNIDVSRNQLTGDASFLFGKSKALQSIDISRNKFEFDFSNVEFPLIDLGSVDISHNMIYGSIPANIGKMTNFHLNFFNASYNRLCGEIPTGGPMKNFDASSYSHNKCLCGTPLPSCK